ncbi:hypothetical protein Csa_019947 [Cucumis sativus]|nr:hypothetical protein Csa_019947 [Cucumis sativus]
MPLSPSPLSPLHSPILLSGFFMVLLTISMLFLIVLFLFIVILCTKRSAKFDGEELLENLDIEAPIFHYIGVEGSEQEYCTDRWFKVDGHCPIYRTFVCVVVVDRSGIAMASSSSLPTPFINRI